MGEWNIYFSKYTANADFGRVTVIALSDVQGEVTTAILRLDSREKLGDVFYVIEVELNVKCI